MPMAMSCAPTRILLRPASIRLRAVNRAEPIVTPFAQASSRGGEVHAAVMAEPRCRTGEGSMSIATAEPFRAPTVEFVVGAARRRFRFSTCSCRNANIRTVGSSMSRAFRAVRPRPWPASGACRCISNRRSGRRKASVFARFRVHPGDPDTAISTCSASSREQLDGLILSHSHRDHYGGLVGFVEHYRTGCATN